MSKKEITRDNHYVPIWYQKGFLLPGREKLRYLDLAPEEIRMPDGRVFHHRNLFESYPTQCFYQTDLYTTFFGAHVNEEIEKKLFGHIDTHGAPAIKAFLGDDLSVWHRRFQDLFIYLDAQKFRTPKGLDWIRSCYPTLSQNALMQEMQGVRTINCTIWSEGVREIVSARNAAVKFLITDHPVTVYNHACPPDHALCRYPADPTIALKSSQTLFPLDQDHCLILTNLEYAEEPGKTDALEKRTFPRPVRQSLVRTDKFIKTRELGDDDVIAINHVLKSCARRYVAAGSKDWLWPEKDFKGGWEDVRGLLLPPKDELWQYGGETFVGYEDGSVHYQDAYGRTTPKTDVFDKDIKDSDLGANDLCGCGSGRKYKKCCRGKPTSRRPSWKTLSIRERNIGFFRALNAILGTDSGKVWNDVRRELDEDKVKRIHELYGFTWPLETDLFDLLPKPDGAPRAVYSGFLDPRTAPFVVSNACLYFGDLLVQNPFINPNQVNKEYSPVENPRSFLTQTLKNILLFFQLYPLIESGHINLFPDPASMDPDLQRYAMELAQERAADAKPSSRDRQLFEQIQKDDMNRMLSMLPREAQERMARKADPDAPEEYIEYFLKHMQAVRENDPLVLLRERVYDGGESGGQFITFLMAPNFEMLLLVAQATGAFVVTDSHHRWDELQAATHREGGVVISRIPRLADHAVSAPLPLKDDLTCVKEMLRAGKLGAHRKWIEGLQTKLSDQDASVNEADMIARHNMATEAVRKDLQGGADAGLRARLHYAAPVGGIYHNHVPRLMVRCGIEDRPDRIPLAVLVDVERK